MTKSTNSEIQMSWWAHGGVFQKKIWSGKWQSNGWHIMCKRVIDNKTVRRQVISICLHMFSEWKQTPFNKLLWLLHVWNSTVVCLAHWKVIFISRAWPKGQKQQWSKQSQARTLSVQTSMENTWCFSAEL